MSALNTYATRTPAAGDWFSGVHTPSGAWGVANFDFETVRRALLAVPVNAQTGTSYDLALSDLGGVVTMANAAANTLSILPNAVVALPVGHATNVLMKGAGVTTIRGATSAVFLNDVPAGAAAIDAQWKWVALLQIAVDEWTIAGAHGAVA